MKLTNREKILLPLALFIIAVALFINFVYLPLNKEVKSLKGQSEDLRIQLEDLEMKEEAAGLMKEAISVSQNDFDQKFGDILKVWDQPELLNFVETTIDPYCEKKSIDFFDPVSINAIQSGEVNIVFITTYYNLMSIWRKLEEAKYYNNITNFQITKAEDSEEESGKKLEVSMNIRFYSQNLDTAFPDKYDFLKRDYGKTEIFD